MIKRAGFYREIGGRATTADDAPSLRDAVQDSGPWDEDRVLAYLGSALEIYTTMGAERDVLTGEEWIAGSGSLMTDGTWLWPVDLTHYVRRHHAALPREFLDHIRANNYTVPVVTDEQARRIFQEEFPDNAPAAAPSKAAGFFTWYVPKLDSARAHQLLTHLETAGLSAVHPLTHALFGFRETPVGNREPLTGDGAALAAALADDRYAMAEFTCWKGYDQSLTGIVRRTDETTQSITLRLTDVPVSDREEAVAALVRTLDQDAADCRGFVIDRAGVSASQDWDRILVGDGGHFTAWPDTVGILRDRVGDHPELADSKPTAYGPLDVFHRP
ncbi:hypothetical protein AQJ66_04185 [Streptomyces bungoensis]|uniref:Uncharacterized protein n=1 Tax=Streptomyces bungoensis TaxID=285568 RepID=A0A101TC55_9ACTN|nr:hypothetical protein [Streptomyces bungoensis]KUN89642.1 hypothetical protein AQJ66_04185 [Streptomyces bungoensis]